MQKLITIAAIGKQNELGKNNDLIWHIPEDLAFFKKINKHNMETANLKTTFSFPTSP